MIKNELLTIIFSNLNQRIENTRQAIQSAKESRDSETKSSVGDKYETGRTLMQIEVEKNRVLLHKTERLKTELEQISIRKKMNSVEFGSIVKTTQNNYFISAAIGKMVAGNEEFYCISLVSPIGKLLQHKKIGDSYTFQGKRVIIEEIL